MRDYHCHKSYNNLSINIYKRQNVRAARSECGVNGMMNRDCQLEGEKGGRDVAGRWWWKWAWHGTCWRVAFKCKTLQKFILSHFACICTVCTHSNTSSEGDGGSVGCGKREHWTGIFGMVRLRVSFWRRGNCDWNCYCNRNWNWNWLTSWTNSAESSSSVSLSLSPSFCHACSCVCGVCACVCVKLSAHTCQLEIVFTKSLITFVLCKTM